MPLPISQAALLPKALQPWQTWLSWLSPELVPAFSEILQRLNRVVGPVHGKHTGGLPEQDGLGVIERKGDYQHLLLSEWLIADELPDEFIRRAINSEHLFLAANHKIEQSLNQITILFDCGPFQLGACRLVHIALLILFAQRAEQAGCDFQWGTLQSPKILLPLENINHLQALLKQRTYSPVLPEHIAQWHEFIQLDDNIQNGELWLVTGANQETLLASIPATHRIELVADDIRQEKIDAYIHGNGHHRYVQLPMPPEKLSIPLIKGNLRLTTIQNSYNDQFIVSLMIPPIISFHGSCIGVALLGRSGFAVIKIPPILNKNNPTNRPQKKNLDYQMYPAATSILALQCHGKRMGALLAYKEGIGFWQLPTQFYINKPPQSDFFASSSRAGILSSAFLHGYEKKGLFVLDIAKRLVFFSSKHHQKGYQALRERVLGIEKIADNALAYIYIEGDSLYQIIVNSELSQQRHLLSIPSKTISDKQKVLFAYRHKYSDGYSTVSCAVSTQLREHECWTLYNMSLGPDAIENVSLPHGWHAIGLYYQRTENNIEDFTQLNLLILNQNKVNIAYYSKGKIEKIYHTNSLIARYTFSPKTGLLALITENKQVVVFDVYNNQLRLSLHSIAQQGADSE
ncbi:hypothetical protein [Providencia sneebia]|uniref:Uncharacterized protein n=1 Tax=Providencia sneebia DSM 19967 TaxID=1141660 RepID=K8WJE3_9GAMM|nr:hypothetical protein [Providencia sneebia]EKT57597.1 hypothetical protein OO7_09450 [Providencia sneebia DSM 19967]